ncbi:hypothetical protein SAMN02745119_02780 [Trichlorobacter thiogenes]|uniref:DUF3631 domain-containing protein n=1 Tax=Trichlorobacter thiogenes TaxID=115783 RepID=A0A1T4RBL3_9BACT|nr:hypothetical protein [Trichlorobacter thiogenes]SKA13297.1 hypothetical protein SAMN02745119_02780 [Trichlorobacter thiogenes]
MSNTEFPCAYLEGMIDVCEGEDGQLVFLLLRDGQLVVEESIKVNGVVLVPPPPSKLPFTIPRLVEVLKYYEQDDMHLYDDLLAYLKRFSALDDLQWSVVAHFVFLTYLHDHHDIDYCPYLLFYAVPERGKSRTGKSVACVAFRGMHIVELREALIFRYSDNIRGTLFFDIMDISKKAEQGGCSDLLLYRAEKGAKSARVLHAERGPFHDTTYFDIYGPTIIASNEQVHKILNTRCLPIDMPNLPGDYQNPRPELGLELKERLTAWRARNLNINLPQFPQVSGISGRLWDITKPMLQMNALVNPQARDLLITAILEISEKRTESKQDTTEGRLVAAIKELTEEKGCEDYLRWTIRTFEISNKYYEHRPDDKRFPVSWFGKKLASMSIKQRNVNGRSEMVFTAEEYERLLEQYGFTGRGNGEGKAPSIVPLPEKEVEKQLVIEDVEEGRGKSGYDGSRRKFSCPEETEIYFERLQIMMIDGGCSRQEAENGAWEAVLQWREDHAV